MTFKIRRSASVTRQIEVPRLNLERRQPNGIPFRADRAIRELPFIRKILPAD
jgi:hypothetical protein